jgi:tRNA isopentenyl-2-thiomethyl-A-37 hydroxylase MiaE
MLVTPAIIIEMCPSLNLDFGGLYKCVLASRARHFAGYYTRCLFGKVG